MNKPHMSGVDQFKLAFQRLTTAALTVTMAVMLMGCGTPTEPEPDPGGFVTTLNEAPMCSDATVTPELVSSGCLTDDRSSLVGFMDRGCGAWTDYGGGLYGDPYVTGSTFVGCP